MVTPSQGTGDFGDAFEGDSQFWWVGGPYLAFRLPKLLVAICAQAGTRDSVLATERGMMRVSFQRANADFGKRIRAESSVTSSLANWRPRFINYFLAGVAEEGETGRGVDQERGAWSKKSDRLSVTCN
jgi:hypothetical protein